MDKEQERHQGLSRAGLGCPWGVRGVQRWWHSSPATEKPLLESVPHWLGRCPDSPVQAAELGLVALPVVVLPSPFLPWWDRLNGMLSSDPSEPSWAVPSSSPALGAHGEQGWARGCPPHPALPHTGEPHVPNIFKLTLYTNNQG